MNKKINKKSLPLNNNMIIYINIVRIIKKNKVPNNRMFGFIFKINPKFIGFYNALLFFCYKSKA